jgi:hypothetical protein
MRKPQIAEGADFQSHVAEQHRSGVDRGHIVNDPTTPV